ncbi:MAG: hypothetical protein ACW98Y_19185 [Candidatus Thorarchaeota archaeon]|jgi:predicted  nucleic acid-binding Zn-ribbon protein
MSTEKENILTQLENLKSTVSQAFDDVERLESEAEELRTTRREAEEKSWASEEENKKITEKLEKTETEKDVAVAQVAELDAELESLKAQAAEVESSKTEAVQALVRERDELRAEMDDITGKLERVSELYRETSAEKDKLQEKVDVSDLLGIYIMLIESVFYGKPHARILYMLHNTKTPITRKNIAQSSGIQPMVVQKAIFDLANADLVTYDEGTQEATLKKAIF